MSSTHRQKIARALAKATGLTYQQALARVVAADDAGHLPHTLDADGINRAVTTLSVGVIAEMSASAADTAPLTISSALDSVFASAPAGLVVVASDSAASVALAWVKVREHLAGTGRKVTAIETPIEDLVLRERQAAGQVDQADRDPEDEITDQVRSVLRRDPDTVLNGTVDTDDTAATTFDELSRAGLSGAWAFGSVRASSPAAAVRRMVNMGADRPLLAGALTAVVWQGRNDDGETVTELLLVDDEVRSAITDGGGALRVSTDWTADRSVVTTTADATSDSEGTATGALASGTSPTSLIVGNSGSGKTFLAREIMGYARDRGHHVVLVDPFGGHRAVAPQKTLHDRLVATPKEMAALEAEVVDLGRSGSAVLVVVENGLEYEAVQLTGRLVRRAHSVPEWLRVVVTSQRPYTVSRRELVDAIPTVRSFETRVVLGPTSSVVAERTLHNHHHAQYLETGWAVVERGRDAEVVWLRGEAPKRAKPAPRVALVDVRTALRRVAALVRLGSHVAEAFGSVAKSLPRPARELFERMSAAVREGVAVDVALAREPDVFEAWAVRAVEAGAVTGRLTEAFDEIAALL